MSPIFAALLAHLGWAVGDNVLISANRTLGFRRVVFWLWATSIPMTLFGALFFWEGVGGMSETSLLQTLGLTVVLLAASFSFNASLEKANAVLAGTIAGAFPAIVVVLSLGLFDEKLSSLQIAALVVTFLGVIGSSIPLSDIRQQKLRIDRNLWYAIFTFLCWGLYFTFIRVPIETQGWYLTSAIVSGFGFLLISATFFILRWSPGRPKLARRDGPLTAIFGAMLTSAATYAIGYAIQYGQSSVVAPIAGSYPALYALLAYFIYKDHLERSQALGVIITLAGVVALSYFSA